MSLASATLCRGKFTEGESRASTSLVSVEPIWSIFSAPYTSTGTASSSAAVWRAREPVTTSIGARRTTLRLRLKSCLASAPGCTTSEAIDGVKPMSRARTVWVPTGTPRSS